VVNDSARARARGDRETVRRLRTRMRQLPRGDPHDPGYRRLRYLRYADDHLLGFTGPKAEAEEIKTRLAGFLREDLKLELSQAKTLITHAKTGAARFLGYEITAQHADHKIINGRRQINGVIALRVPRDVIKAKCASYLERGEPARCNPLVNEDDHTIVATYGAEYRGLVEYYLRPRRRRRWPASTTRRWPRWPPATGPSSPHRSGHADASRSVLNATVGSHWLHGSAGSRCGASAMRSCTTAIHPR
jgi:hypothetical protein